MSYNPNLQTWAPQTKSVTPGTLTETLGLRRITGNMKKQPLNTTLLSLTFLASGVETNNNDFTGCDEDEIRYLARSEHTHT